MVLSLYLRWALSPYGSTEKAAYSDRLAQISMILQDTASTGRQNRWCVSLQATTTVTATQQLLYTLHSSGLELQWQQNQSQIRDTSMLICVTTEAKQLSITIWSLKQEEGSLTAGRALVCASRVLTVYIQVTEIGIKFFSKYILPAS